MSKIIVLPFVLRTTNDAKTNGEVRVMLKNKKYFSIIFGFLLFFSLIVQGSPVYGDNTGYEPENPGIKDEQTAEGDLGMVVRPIRSLQKWDQMCSGMAEMQLMQP